MLLPIQNGQYGKGRVQRSLTEGLPIGTYNIIYADPPWRYEQRKVQGAAENHYPTMSMGNVSFTIEEENLICIYHKYDRRRTIAAISDALPDMDADMRPLAEQTIHKLHNMTDAAFEETQFTMTLSDAE